MWDIDRLQRGALLSNTQPLYKSLRTPPTTKKSVRASTARGEAGISVPHGTWRGGDSGTALHRAVLNTTLTYYHSFRTPPKTKRSVRASTARGEAGISVPHGTRRCGDTGMLRCRTALCSTEPYTSVPSKCSAYHSAYSVPASTVARGKKPALPDGKQQYARINCSIIYMGCAQAFLDLFGPGFGARPWT